jgi:hypothetical protein
MGRNLVSHQLVGDKLDRKGYYHVGETISKLLHGTHDACSTSSYLTYVSPTHREPADRRAKRRVWSDYAESKTPALHIQRAN